MTDAEMEESLPLMLSESQTQAQGAESVSTASTEEMTPATPEIVEPEVFRTVADETLAVDHEIFKSKVVVGSLVFAKSDDLYRPGEVVEKDDDEFKVRFSDGTTTLAKVTEIFPDLALTKGIFLLNSASGEKGVLMGYRKIEDEVLPTKQFEAVLKIVEDSKEMLKAVPRSQLAIDPSIVAAFFPSPRSDTAPSNDSSLFPLSGEVPLPDMQSTPHEEHDGSGDAKTHGQEDGNDTHSRSNGVPEEANDDKSSTSKSSSGRLSESKSETKSVERSVTTETKDESSPGESFSPYGRQKEHDSSDTKSSQDGSQSDNFRPPHGTVAVRKNADLICTGPLLPNNEEWKLTISLENRAACLAMLTQMGEMTGNKLFKGPRKSSSSSSSSSNPRPSTASTFSGYEGDIDATISTMSSEPSEQLKPRGSVTFLGETIPEISSKLDSMASPALERGRAEIQGSPEVVELPTSPKPLKAPQHVDLVSPDAGRQSPPPEEQTPAAKTPRDVGKLSRKKKAKGFTPRKKTAAKRSNEESTTETEGPSEPKRKPRKNALQKPSTPDPLLQSSSEDTEITGPLPSVSTRMENDFRIGRQVYARWMAKGATTGYYPGTLTGRAPTSGQWKVTFEDGAMKSLPEDEIFPQFALRMTPEISYKLSDDDEEYSRGVIIRSDIPGSDILIRPAVGEDRSATEETGDEGPEPIKVHRRLTFFSGAQTLFLFRTLSWGKKPAVGTMPTAAVVLDQVVSSRTRPSNKYGTPAKDDGSSRVSASKLSTGKRGRPPLRSTSETSDSSVATPRKRKRGSAVFVPKKGKKLRTILKDYTFVLSFGEETPFYMPAPLNYIEEEAGEDFTVTLPDGKELTRDNLKEQLKCFGALTRDSVDDLAGMLMDGMRDCYLISNRVTTTKEYLKAAACGIPIFSIDWLLDVIYEGAMKSMTPYRIRSGEIERTGEKGYESKKFFDVKVGVTSRKAEEDKATTVAEFWHDVVRRGPNDIKVITFDMNDIDKLDVGFVIGDEMDEEQLTELQKKFHIPFVDPEWVLKQLKDKSFKDSLVDEMVLKAKND